MQINNLLIPPFLLVTSSIFAADSCDNVIRQAEMSKCAYQAYQAADIEMNATYREMMSRLKLNKLSTLTSVEKLKYAQRAWISFRDAECAFVGTPTENGTINSMVVATCLTKQTKSRTKIMRGYLDCPEGDASCPLPPPQR
ncbi:lysozyme inhibitor LprI family protein [Pseudomonas sp. A014]|uniref:lysozyme inhibitor LprI family protein n=1 Tax=Pseudomonas sp. A014 TaxID=3458058 RepID=UPI00403522A0